MSPEQQWVEVNHPVSHGLVRQQSRMTLVPLLLEGYSKNPENHHNPTLT